MIIRTLEKLMIYIYTIQYEARQFRKSTDKLYQMFTYKWGRMKIRNCLEQKNLHHRQ